MKVQPVWWETGQKGSLASSCELFSWELGLESPRGTHVCIIQLLTPELEMISKATPLFRHQVQIQSRTPEEAEPPCFYSILIWTTCESQGTGLNLLLGLSHIACFNLLAFGSEAGEEITFSNSTRYVKRKEVGEEIFLFGLTGQSMGQPKGIDLMEAGRSVGRKSWRQTRQLLLR